MKSQRIVAKSRLSPEQNRLAGRRVNCQHPNSEHSWKRDTWRVRQRTVDGADVTVPSIRCLHLSLIQICALIQQEKLKPTCHHEVWACCCFYNWPTVKVLSLCYCQNWPSPASALSCLLGQDRVMLQSRVATSFPLPSLPSRKPHGHTGYVWRPLDWLWLKGLMGLGIPAGKSDCKEWLGAGH